MISIKKEHLLNLVLLFVLFTIFIFIFLEQSKTSIFQDDLYRSNMQKILTLSLDRVVVCDGLYGEARSTIDNPELIHNFLKTISTIKPYKISHPNVKDQPLLRVYFKDQTVRPVEILLVVVSNGNDEVYGYFVERQNGMVFYSNSFVCKQMYYWLNVALPG